MIVSRRELRAVDRVVRPSTARMTQRRVRTCDLGTSRTKSAT